MCRWMAYSGEPVLVEELLFRPVHSIITNSTYDGLCYNARRVEELLSQVGGQRAFR